MAEQYHTMSDEEMLKRLRVVFERKGRLSFGIINEAAAIPSTATYVKRFGSLRKLYALVGYRSPRNCDWIDAREHWSDVLRKHAVQIAEALNSSRDVEAIVEERGRRLTVNGTNFSFFTARQLPKPKPTYLPQWRVYCRHRASGMMVLLRLDHTAKEIEDYLLLPTSAMTGCYLRFSPIALHGAIRAKTLAKLITKIKVSCKKSKERDLRLGV